MVAATPILLDQAPVPSTEPRVLLQGVPWEVYVALRDAVDSPALRMTYLRGDLEIMSPSRAHEVNKTQIARFLELFCLERDIPFYGYGQTTFRNKPGAAGLEPDECYARGEDKEIPDLAIEVVHSRPLVNKLDAYLGLGIGEVWLFENGAFRVLVLRGHGYDLALGSAVLPEVDLDELATFVVRSDQHEALKAYRDALRRRG